MKDEKDMPLKEVKAVDLTRIISDLFCTMLLADMGAEVIEINDASDLTIRPHQKVSYP